MDSTETTAEEKQSRTFRKWYKKHGTELNEKRRERYHNDPKYRKKCIEQAKRAKERRKQRGGVAETTVVRVVKGKKTILYRMSGAAEQLGKSPDTIRLWYRKGYLPNDGQPGEHRLFTGEQIKLLSLLAYTIDKYRYASNYKKILKECTKHIAEKW